MNTVESPEGQELQKLGSRVWDKPAYSGPPFPHGTVRVYTVSNVVVLHPQSKKLEDGPQEKTHKTLLPFLPWHQKYGVGGFWDIKVQRRGYHKL
jgi:polycystin 2L1